MKYGAMMDVDYIQFRMSCGINALGAIHTAMEEGPFTAESHVDGLYGVYDYLSNLNNELRKIIDGSSAEAKAV